jgi:lipopolysaccharide biosynthesis glycosyltransferase
MRGVVFSIDDAYVMPFKVLWHSLMKTRSLPSKTPVFILHEDTLAKSSITELTEFIDLGSYGVSFINTSSRLPDDLPLAENDHVSRATFYRLYVASVLPDEIESVVYLDSDAVVSRSIRYLFEIELTHPVAAVDALSPYDQLRVWGNHSGNYFGAGVLIIDLNIWRSSDCESLFNKILSNERSRISWWDQCVLNIAFENNWQRLPIWFNVTRYVVRSVDPTLLNTESRFLHFDGGEKPWKYNVDAPHASCWYQSYSECFGKPFDRSVLKRLLWTRLGGAIKRILKHALQEIKIFLEVYNRKK